MLAEDFASMCATNRTLSAGLARGRAMVVAAELLREAAIGHEIDPTTPEAEARRERILAKMLILLALLRLGRFGRQRGALAEVQQGMAEQLAWSIEQA